VRGPGHAQSTRWLAQRDEEHGRAWDADRRYEGRHLPVAVRRERCRAGPRPRPAREKLTPLGRTEEGAKAEALAAAAARHARTTFLPAQGSDQLARRHSAPHARTRAPHPRPPTAPPPRHAGRLSVQDQNRLCFLGRPPVEGAGTAAMANAGAWAGAGRGEGCEGRSVACVRHAMRGAGGVRGGVCGRLAPWTARTPPRIVVAPSPRDSFARGWC